MSPSTIIHLMRHAQHDTSSSQLTAHGIAQAHAFARVFEDANYITHIFCSPLIRCKETAKIALQRVVARGIPIVIIKELEDNREMGGISFVWRYLSIRERNEVVIITHGSVLPTILTYHHVEYQEQYFPNVTRNSYLLIQALQYIPTQELANQRGPTYLPSSYLISIYKLVANFINFLRYFAFCWLGICLVVLAFYLTNPSSFQWGMFDSH